MASVVLMNQAEYAKHRGVSRVAVHQAVKAQRISLIDGKIDPAVADIQWSANTRARAPASPGQTPTDNGATVDPDAGDDGRGYWSARSRREKAEASMAEMKHEEMQGTLIKADAVRSAWSAKITGARDALLQIPSRIAPVLAAETDLARVTALLEAELRQALSELSTNVEAL
jgi:phage terminase Nu1 subunit (DNA packaging protein)